MKKMLKVLTGVLASCMLVALVAGSAFAETEDTYPSMQGATEVANPSKSETTDVSSDAKAEGEALTITGEKKSIEDATAASLSGIAASDLKFIQEWEIHADKLPADITFTVAGTEGKYLYVFHKGEKGWELVGQGAGPKVKVTFTSLSPVAIYAGPAPAATAPKTGENSMLLYGAMVAIMLGGTLAVVALRKKAE